MRRRSPAKERGFLPACAGTNLEDGIALVGFVRRQEEKLERFLLCRHRRHQLGALGLRQRPHLGLALGVVGHRLKVTGFVAGGAQRRDRIHDRRELGVLARKLRELGTWRWRYGRKRVAELPVAVEHPVQALLEPGGGAHRPGA